jgi:uncharacterized protein YodC (DUF2158 family)
MQNLKIGDVVILKSGGPPMTIHNIGDYSPMGPNPGVLCVWFDNSKKVEDVFNPATLELFAMNA